MSSGPGGRLRRGWRSRHTLRARVTVVASLGITAAVVLGLVAMYLLQVSSVRRTIDSQLRTYATQIAQSAPTGHWPRPLPASTLDPQAAAQVISADGRVLAATRTLAGVPPVYLVAAGSDAPVRQRAADGVVPGEVRVVAVRTTVDGGPVTIIAGASTSLLQELKRAYVRQIFLGLPVILVLAAAAVWLVVGRALRPVKRIRLAVTDITSADLSRRVPEPGTDDEIGLLAHTMNDMLARLEDSARRQRRFVADASHELRTPLAAIRTTLEVGLAHPDRAPWPAIAGRAAQQADRLEQLVQQLLRLARADERRPPTRTGPVDVARLLHDVTTSTLTDAVRIDLDLGDDATVLGNADDLTRLFRNIIDNAVRHAASTVSITATTTGARVLVQISDDGPGIPVADRDRVFDRFVRLDSSRERGSGTTGLGLAIAREIATAHSGSIVVAEGSRGGARIDVRLPRAPAPTRSPSTSLGV